MVCSTSNRKAAIRNKHGFATDQLFYNAEQDCYICPMGQRMDFIGTFKKKTSSGFIQHIKNYRTRNCAGCPLNGACHKAKSNRVIQINESLERFCGNAPLSAPKTNGLVDVLTSGSNPL